MKVGAVLIASTLMFGGMIATPPRVADARQAPEFSDYHTYDWIDRQQSEDIHPLTYQQIRASIDQALTARGYRYENAGDFAVTFEASHREGSDVSDPGSHGPAWGRAAGLSGQSATTEGILVVEIFDVATNKRVWRGEASDEITEGMVSQKEIDRIVGKALKRVPKHRSK